LPVRQWQEARALLRQTRGAGSAIGQFERRRGLRPLDDSEDNAAREAMAGIGEALWQQPRLVGGVLAPLYLLDYLRFFVVFEGGGSPR